MTKISLGPTKGTVDEEEFDIVEDILSIVAEYRSDVSKVIYDYEKKLAQLEAQKEQELRDLKDNLKRKLKS